MNMWSREGEGTGRAEFRRGLGVGRLENRTEEEPGGVQRERG